MVFRRVVFCGVISKIVLGTFPVDVELFLSLSVAEPVEAHIHSFGSALYYVVGEDANGTFVIELEWSGTLGMAHFGEGCAHGNGIFGVDEAGAGFRFLDGGHDGVDDLGVDQDRGVEGQSRVFWFYWKFGSFREEKEAAVARACF